MFGIDFTFLWTAVNLLVVYLVINKFLFKKLGIFMEERSASISANIENGETFKAEGEQYRRQHEELLSEAASKRKEILDEAKQKASKEYENIINDAKKEATRIIKEGREEIRHERERLQKELQRDIASLAISAASKVIEANMDNEKNRGLVNNFISSEGAA